MRDARRRSAILVTLSALAATVPAPSRAHDARMAEVTKVSDCDSFSARVIEIAVGGDEATRPYRVRVRGVSAPEIRGPERPLGLLCLETLRRWLEPGDRVELVGPFDRDPRGRLVARVLLVNGRDLAVELLRHGLALPWDYPREARPAFDVEAPYPLEVPPAW